MTVQLNEDLMLTMIQEALANGLDKDRVLSLVENQAEKDFLVELEKRGQIDSSTDPCRFVYEYCTGEPLCGREVRTSNWKGNASITWAWGTEQHGELHVESNATNESGVA